MLNLGQASIIAAGLTLIMLMAAREVRDGTMTVGKFVLVNTYLIQLYQPLNFLGIVYMTIKQGLVDMEQMFACSRSTQEIADKPGAAALVAHLSDGPAGEVRVRGRSFRLSVGPHDPEGHRLHRAGRAQAGDRRSRPAPASRPSAGCCSASTT